MKPNNLNLPADFARCNGRIYVNDAPVLCEKRDKCCRWLAAPTNHPRLVELLVAGKENVINCEHFVPHGGIGHDQRRTVEDA